MLQAGWVRLMERGFKSRCEEMARSLRVELEIDPTGPLLPKILADYLGVFIWSVEELGLSPEDVNQLVEVDGDSWSAVTVSASGRDAILLNPTHIKGRYSSDVMHELAHLLLGHQPSTIFFAGQENLALRGFNPELEEQANWLAGALLLPRDALVKLQVSGRSESLICDEYEVSKQMLRFRLDVTGVNRQLAQRRKRTGRGQR